LNNEVKQPVDCGANSVRVSYQTACKLAIYFFVSDRTLTGFSFWKVSYGWYEIFAGSGCDAMAPSHRIANITLTDSIALSDTIG
jgi:hypothetical protein